MDLVEINRIELTVVSLRSPVVGIEPRKVKTIALLSFRLGGVCFRLTPSPESASFRIRLSEQISVTTGNFRRRFVDGWSF
jgi:hypothetical protein